MLEKANDGIEEKINKATSTDARLDEFVCNTLNKIATSYVVDDLDKRVLLEFEPYIMKGVSDYLNIPISKLRGCEISAKALKEGFKLFKKQSLACHVNIVWAKNYPNRFCLDGEYLF